MTQNFSRRWSRLWLAFTTLATGLCAVTLHAAEQPLLHVPLEVMGEPGTVREIPLAIPEEKSCDPCLLYARVHGLAYAGQASIQIDEGNWAPLDEKNAYFRVLGLGRTYGGIGGGFNSPEITVSLPPLGPGLHYLRFRFNQSNGVSSGFRIVEFNLFHGQEPLLPAEVFLRDDPAAWQPPYPDEQAIARGKELWYNASLTVPVVESGGAAPIRAHCADCHAQDGRDLKYFNYSNFAIRTRAMFHGLNQEEGDLIASYIRSLATPSPAQARPWNPPYQPGPGLDSRPVSEWSAGAGLEAVLARDRDTFSHIFPNGIQPGPTSNQANLSVRETPVAFQLPDWNHWLPQVHPKDAYPEFEDSEAFKLYQQLRRRLAPGSASHYRGAREQFIFLRLRILEFLQRHPVQALPNGRWRENDVRATYSAMLWLMSKAWELNQEFELEGLSQQWHGPQADERAWNNDWAFHTSPNMIKIPSGSPGLGNSRAVTHTYVSTVWYHLQLILNHSNGHQSGTTPIDWPYAFGFIMGMTRHSPQAGLAAIWQTKSGQISRFARGPEFAAERGWAHIIHNFPVLVHHDMLPTWSELDPAERNAFLEIQLQYWLEAARQYTPEQFYQGRWTSPNDRIANGGPMSDGNFPTRVAWAIRQLQKLGVNPQSIQDLIAWAQSMWPSHNWNQEPYLALGRNLAPTSFPARSIRHGKLSSPMLSRK